MLERIDNSYQHFIEDFQNIYQNPEKINNFLNENSDNIEKKIENLFLRLDLDKNFCIYANGGFGRKEMFPTSDIDISIIEMSKPKSYESLEKFVSSLWDEGYQIGHSVRSIQDIKKISKQDVKEFTSYLTRRPIITVDEVDSKITKVLLKLWSKNKFFNAKNDEQLVRHKDYHSTSYNLEPDLKESPGTLRDFQTALWILQHCFGLYDLKSIEYSDNFKNDISNAIEAYNFIKTLRFASNVFTKKNRLNFEAQIDISKIAKLKTKNTNRSVEIMMKKFYEMASILTHFNELVFETYKEKDLKIKKYTNDTYKLNNKIGIFSKEFFDDSMIFQIFIEIGRNKSIISIDTKTMDLLKKNLKLIDQRFRKNNDRARQFLEILKSKYNLSSILNSMKKLGILQKYIPEFGDVVGQMQFDLFHVYTVDEHTFKVVRSMRQMKIFEDKDFQLENELINKLPKIEILYIAGLFHDLGKGQNGDHSKIGAKTSYKFAKRLGMSDTDAYLISWLVEKHLIMSSISQKKDISDKKTVEDFASEIKVVERLDYLYLLTINDIKSTNPKLWNGWKHQLLRDLYISTRSKLNKEPEKAFSEIAKERKSNVLDKLNTKNEKNNLINHMNSYNDDYFNKNTTNMLLWQSELLSKAIDQDFIIGCREKFDSLIEIFIKVKNSDGLFYKLAKVLEHSGLEVIDASIFTSNNNDIAANTFITKYIHHDRSLTKNELVELSERINKNFMDYERISNLPKKKQKKQNFAKMIQISHSINEVQNRNMITIKTANSIGLLAKIAKVFYANKISIFCARINTLGERVEDTFEITNEDNTIISEIKIKKIIKSLEMVV
jgi:[protein-PII] uridylyltransferase